MRIAAAGSRQHVVIGRCIRNLVADVGRSIHKAVDVWCVRVLINLLDAAGELIGWLRPVVILHRDHEHFLDFLRVTARTTHGQAC